MALDRGTAPRGAGAAGRPICAGVAVRSARAGPVHPAPRQGRRRVRPQSDTTQRPRPEQASAVRALRSYHWQRTCRRRARHVRRHHRRRRARRGRSPRTRPRRSAARPRPRPRGEPPARRRTRPEGQQAPSRAWPPHPPTRPAPAARTPAAHRAGPRATPAVSSPHHNRRPGSRRLKPRCVTRQAIPPPARALDPSTAFRSGGTTWMIKTAVGLAYERRLARKINL